MTRGVLFDMPRLKGLSYLEPGTAIYTEDLEAWERKAGLKVSPGDAIFLRTEAVAETAAKLNRWEFMVTIAPVPVTGGTGFPVNTIATF